MHYYEVAPTRIVRENQHSFTYASETALSQGQLVRVPLGKTHTNGVVLKTSTKPSYDVKLIKSVLEPTPLPTALLQLATWLSHYYATPYATVLQSLLPRGLEKNRRARQPQTFSATRKRTYYVLNKDQLSAVSYIETMSSGTAVLHGVTGSGKTATYIELAKRTLARGSSVIMLVPEIALTSQLIAEFSHHFDNILLTHSRQTEAERHQVWRDALTSTSPRVAIGPRSALFLPLPSIGLIIIDEAHEPSYKQEQSPRYSALRAASQLSTYHSAKLILGSATPSVSDYYMAIRTNRPIITLPHRAQPDAAPPTIQLVDMTKRANFKQHRFLSDQLLTAISQTHRNGKQSLLFHNRRGSASVTLCEQCGWQAGCPRCFVPLTLHADQHKLRCHICAFTSSVPSSCPQCHYAGIIHKGIGTKLIASELQRLFPTLTIGRFDGDSAVEATVHSRYHELYDGSIDVIIGTQVVAKGLDLPHLQTVGIVQADAGLALPDYIAGERSFQLLAQAIGRVGRSSDPTNVVVQSYQPTHPVVTAGIAQDYQGFYAATLAQRQRAHFPPYSYLLQLTCVYKTEATAIKNSKALATTLRKHLPAEVAILGPTPAFYERIRDTYRWQLLLKAPNRSMLVEALAFVPAQHWQYELDPASLL